MTIVETLWWKYRHRLFPSKYSIGVDRDARARLTTITYTRVDRRGVYHVDRIEQLWHDGAVMSITGADTDKLLELISKRSKDADSV